MSVKEKYEERYQWTAMVWKKSGKWELKYLISVS